MIKWGACAGCGMLVAHYGGEPHPGHLASKRHAADGPDRQVVVVIPPDLAARLEVLRRDLQVRSVGPVTLRDVALWAIRAGIETAIVREADRIADAGVEPF